MSGGGGDSGGGGRATVSMDAVKKQLAVAWFAGSALPFLIVLGQTIGGTYGDQVDKAWAWLLPTVMPTLSLIVGVLVSDAHQPDRVDLRIDPFVARLALAFSVIYLAIVLSTVLVQPFALTTPLSFLNLSHLWLAPLQGLVSAVMGALFVKQGKPERPG